MSGISISAPPVAGRKTRAQRMRCHPLILSIFRELDGLRASDDAKGDVILSIVKALWRRHVPLAELTNPSWQDQTMAKTTRVAEYPECKVAYVLYSRKRYGPTKKASKQQQKKKPLMRRKPIP